MHGRNQPTCWKDLYFQSDEFQSTSYITYRSALYVECTLSLDSTLCDEYYKGIKDLVYKNESKHSRNEKVASNRMLSITFSKNACVSSE